MRTPIWLGVIGLALFPASVAGQIDSTARARLFTRVLQGDTTLVRFKNPVSRVVLEAVWAVTDTQRRQVPATVVGRPAWSSQVVLFNRMIRKRPNDPVPRIAVAARRIARPPVATPLTAVEDSTLRRQRAADFRVRAEALARIQAVPPARLHPSIATNLINELDSVGATRMAMPPGATAETPEELEAYPEYVISLTRAVVRLKDPRSIRALTLGGLVTSREVQRFVAAQGPAALGSLDTAFAASDATAPAVVSTWGYALAANPSQLTFGDSVYVYARIVMSSQVYPVSFAYAARHANLFELIPELDSIHARAATDSQPVLAAVARGASRKLAPVRASAIPADWLARLRLRTGVACMDESRMGVDRCRALLEATTSASGSLSNLDQLRQEMTRYRAQLDDAVSAGTMSGDERGSLGLLVAGLLRAAGDRSGVGPGPLRRPAGPPR